MEHCCRRLAEQYLSLAVAVQGIADYAIPAGCFSDDLLIKLLLAMRQKKYDQVGLFVEACVEWAGRYLEWELT